MSDEKPVGFTVSIVIDGQELGGVAGTIKSLRVGSTEQDIAEYDDEGVRSAIEELWFKEIEVSTENEPNPGQVTVSQEGGLSMIVDEEETPLKRCWWEGEDFFTETEDGQIWRFSKAYVRTFKSFVYEDVLVEDDV